jgi:hypothetical protein
LLSWGYADARSEIDSVAGEDDITGRIIERIKDRLDDPDTPSEYRFYQVNDQSPVRGSTKSGMSRPRLDIVTTCSIKVPRPEFIFEAKRLRVKGFPIGAYVGKKGMLRFLKGQYASNSPSAGMIGYVQSHNAARWMAELARMFSRKTRSSLRIRENLSVVNVHPSIKDEFVSKHGRVKNTDLVLFHVFLNCT